MSSEKFLDDKSLKRLDKEINLIIERTGQDRKTQDEVFDKPTLHTLEKLISDGFIDILDFPISTGKEGNVFRAITPKKKFVAIKIYRTSNATFKHISDYILGDPRFESIHNTKRDIIFAWAKKEFKNLEKLSEVGIRAPKPIKYVNNVLIMEYIGDETRPAPLLKDIEIKNPKKLFDTLIEYISIMYKKANLVHCDFSQYNILIHKNKPYVIDLGQGVLIEHPNSHEFLKRDIHNTVNFFKRHGIRADEKSIYKKITKLTW